MDDLITFMFAMFAFKKTKQPVAGIINKNYCENEPTLMPLAFMPHRKRAMNSGVMSALRDSWRHLPHREHRNQYGNIWSTMNVLTLASVLPFVAQTRFHLENAT